MCRPSSNAVNLENNHVQIRRINSIEQNWQIKAIIKLFDVPSNEKIPLPPCYWIVVVENCKYNERKTTISNEHKETRKRKKFCRQTEGEINGNISVFILQHIK